MSNGIFDNDDTEKKEAWEFENKLEPEPFAPQAFTPVSPPVSTEETVRRSGLAWSAGIVFFSSIAFMLFLGWGADLLLGSSPWGLVGGIVIGSIIGFIQFFRLTSRIFNTGEDKNAIRPLLTREDDEK